MIELLIRNAPGLIYVAGFAIALAGAWAVCRHFRGVGRESFRTQVRVIIVLTLLALGVLLAWRMAVRADRDMRADLLQQTRVVAQGVDRDRLRALTGTAADVNLPAYRRLKEQFAAVRLANPQCRFVYLMGRKADGTVFFFVDDRPVGDAEEAPAGMIYDDVPEGFRRALASGMADTAGPFTDKWGTFVSGAVPITHPDTGAVIALLGLDFDARAWKWGGGPDGSARGADARPVHCRGDRSGGRRAPQRGLGQADPVALVGAVGGHRGAGGGGSGGLSLATAAPAPRRDDRRPERHGQP